MRGCASSWPGTTPEIKTVLDQRSVNESLYDYLMAFAVSVSVHISVFIEHGLSV